MQAPVTTPTPDHGDVQMHEEVSPDKESSAIEPTERAPDQPAEPVQQADADDDMDEDEEVCLHPSALQICCNNIVAIAVRWPEAVALHQIERPHDGSTFCLSIQRIPALVRRQTSH